MVPGVLTRIEPGTVPVKVIVNDEPVDLKAVHARWQSSVGVREYWILDDAANPLVLCALSLAPVTGGGRSSIRAFVSMARWTALPMPQPRLRGTLPAMPLQHAKELIGDGEVLHPQRFRLLHQFLCPTKAIQQRVLGMHMQVREISAHSHSSNAK